jgi:hypothetical protein
MAELRFYESHLSREAVAFVVGLSKRRQRVVFDLADRIARQPSKIGDYQYIDTAGRAIENLRLEGYVFSYWVDHGSKEVRVTENIRL